MIKKLFVGNLSHGANKDELREYFSSAGTVVAADIIFDRMTGKSRGFGFVEMSTEEEAKKAAEEFNGKEFQGRPLVVNEARPKEDRPPRSGGGGGGFRGGGGGGGGYRGGGGGGGFRGRERERDRGDRGDRDRGDRGDRGYRGRSDRDDY